MGKKQLKFLLILLVVMGAAALALKTTQSGKVVKSKSITEREDLITDFPINDVTEVEIVDGESSVTLKKGDVAWTVLERDGFTAKSDSLVSFLRLIWALKITQVVQVGESQHGRLHLLPTSEGKEKKEGEVEKTIYFKGKDGKVLKTIYLGKAYERMENSSGPFGGGPRMNKVARYVKIEGEDGVFLVAETFAAADTNPAKWLDEKFFAIANIKSVEIKSGNKDEDWKLTRDKTDGEFVLAGVKKDEKYDATRANAIKNAFSSPRFEDVVVGDTAAKKPSKTTFVIDTFAGFHYVVKVSDKSDLNEYFLTVDVSAKLDDKRAAVKDESEEDKKKNDEAFVKAVKVQQEKLDFEKNLSGKVFKVRSYVVDSINKKRGDLMKQDKQAAGGQPSGMPAGFPGGGAGGLPGGAGGIPPEMLQKILSGAKMPGGHPPVKPVTAPAAPKADVSGVKKPQAEKTAPKKVEAKKVEVKVGGDKKTVTEAPEPAPTKREAKQAAKKMEKESPVKADQAEPQVGKPAAGKSEKSEAVSTSE